MMSPKMCCCTGSSNRFVTWRHSRDNAAAKPNRSRRACIRPPAPEDRVAVLPNVCRRSRSLPSIPRCRSTPSTRLSRAPPDVRTGRVGRNRRLASSPPPLLPHHVEPLGPRDAVASRLCCPSSDQAESPRRVVQRTPARRVVPVLALSRSGRPPGLPASGSNTGERTGPARTARRRGRSRSSRRTLIDRRQLLDPHLGSGTLRRRGPARRRPPRRSARAAGSRSLPSSACGRPRPDGERRTPGLASSIGSVPRSSTRVAERRCLAV